MGLVHVLVVIVWVKDTIFLCVFGILNVIIFNEEQKHIHYVVKVCSKPLANAIIMTSKFETSFIMHA